MADAPKDQQQTEQTRKGLTVPVPKRHEFFGNLKKIAQPKPDATQSRGIHRQPNPRGRPSKGKSNK